MVRDGAHRSQVYAGCACYGAPPHHEAGRERAKSYPPAQEDILVELGPVLVFANVVGPIGEIEPLELGAGARCIAARRVIAKLLVKDLALLRHQELHEQHCGMWMRRLAGDGDTG